MRGRRMLIRLMLMRLGMSLHLLGSYSRRVSVDKSRLLLCMHSRLSLHLLMRNRRFHLRSSN